jgi:hypothetical protein
MLVRYVGRVLIQSDIISEALIQDSVRLLRCEAVAGHYMQPTGRGVDKSTSQFIPCFEIVIHSLEERTMLRI